MILLEPSASQLAVNETVIVENSANTTFTDPAQGSLRFYLPPAAKGQVQVNAQGPQGMPLPRPAEPTTDPGVYKVVFPIKPGQTEFQVTYVLPASAPLTFTGRVVGIKGMDTTPMRLIAPPGVTFAGKALQQVGVEPSTQATIYNVLTEREFTVDVAGVGSLNAGANAATDESDAPSVTEGRPQIYAHLPWLLASAFCVLAVGLLLLWRSPLPPDA
jgi:hypothetical protein